MRRGRKGATNWGSKSQVTAVGSWSFIPWEAGESLGASMEQEPEIPVHTPTPLVFNLHSYWVKDVLGAVICWHCQLPHS